MSDVHLGLTIQPESFVEPTASAGGTGRNCVTASDFEGRFSAPLRFDRQAGCDLWVWG